MDGRAWRKGEMVRTQAVPIPRTNAVCGPRRVYVGYSLWVGRFGQSGPNCGLQDHSLEYTGPHCLYSAERLPTV